ncbi:Cytochrome P450 CYP736A12 like [Actinidia chinensis var. chinensis]|uniref:Cytochrome P450 CYP736A12 like n=1 Tax=Actinidia chinensis var. chinensis TaxID=1590841 RepID=A0A2R6PRK9_ACTCC|nr:Cytochrome P450 CYP736A12 like [Actinidia chinensis var. chinensis]
MFLKTHTTVFASRPKSQSSQYLAYGTKGIVFTEYGPYWRNVRKFCVQELLSAVKIDSFAGMRREEMGRLVEEMKEAAERREVVDVSERVESLIEDMTYKMILGQSKDDRFDLKGIIKEAVSLTGVFNIADYVPFLRALDLQGLAPRFKATSKAIDEILETILDEHQDVNRNDQKHYKDFIDTALSLMNKSSNTTQDHVSNSMDRENIKAIVLDMVVGSIDTSSTAIEWTLTEIIRHPRVMKRLHQELTTILGASPMVEEKDLAKLEYLDMVVKETLRLHPVGPLLIPRESTEDIVINNYYIPKRSRIIVNAWALGRNCDVWSDNAEEFFPERFIGSNIDLRGHHFELIPFGSGRRICPGMNSGLLNIKLVVAQLVLTFGWELPNGMSPKDLDMSERFRLTAPRAQHLLAIPIYRANMVEK